MFAPDNPDAVSVQPIVCTEKGWQAAQTLSTNFDP